MKHETPLVIFIVQFWPSGLLHVKGF